MMSRHRCQYREPAHAVARGEPLPRRSDIPQVASAARARQDPGGNQLSGSQRILIPLLQSPGLQSGVPLACVDLACINRPTDFGLGLSGWCRRPTLISNARRSPLLLCRVVGQGHDRQLTRSAAHPSFAGGGSLAGQPDASRRLKSPYSAGHDPSPTAERSAVLASLRRHLKPSDWPQRRTVRLDTSVFGQQ